MHVIPFKTLAHSDMTKWRSYINLKGLSLYISVQHVQLDKKEQCSMQLGFICLYSVMEWPFIYETDSDSELL